MDVTIYILRCADGAYDTGLTKQPIESRLWEHDAGIIPRLHQAPPPVALVFTEPYHRLLDAIVRERQIKRWSRARKEARITGRHEDLPALSRSRQAGIAPEAQAAEGDLDLDHPSPCASRACRRTNPERVEP